VRSHTPPMCHIDSGAAHVPLVCRYGPDKGFSGP
jgi:hypothetical protein